ncbi:DUF2515 family protein [Cohnella kolymensis]|uniref:DUF2515 family protein n=1 Tax=Cohnella kolymensis TaxID=1590652 RepID=UPI000698934C|nr:DUF2515 family protein [Cohnella kolymensis]
MPLVEVFKHLALGLAGKGSALWGSFLLTRRRNDLHINPEGVEHFRRQLISVSRSERNRNGTLSAHEKELCTRILAETAEFNRNNVTRTSAYWRFYEAHLELHWSFLAHMVSRNGGWNMTDLKGQWTPQVMDGPSLESIFKLLEACNALIFGDAYPQLLLYSESRRTGRPLWHLLPQFGVSRFMQPFWNRFWIDRNPVPLTVALIINEQNVIQGRVVADPYYRNRVFDTVSFRSQPILQLNQVVVPLRGGGDSGNRSSRRLAGRVLEDFTNLSERIEFGKSLYAMLFGYPAVLQSAHAFALQVPHTGSRADYWPSRFSKVRRQQKDGSPATEHAALDKLWFSPPLAEAWPDRPLSPVSEGDWFDSLDILSHLQRIDMPLVIDMTHEHLFGQYKMQTAVLSLRNK